MQETIVTTYAEANSEYDLEQYVEAPFFDDAAVRIYSDSTRIEGNFDISQHGNCLFLKDLQVTGNIVNSSDGAGPVFLIVLGNCGAKNVFISEPLVCIQETLTVENGVLADYNEGLLRVRGDLVAKVICAEHEVWISGRLQGTSVDLGGLHVQDENFSPTISQTQLRDAPRYFVAEVLKDKNLNGQALRARLEAGAPILI